LPGLKAVETFGADLRGEFGGARPRKAGHCLLPRGGVGLRIGQDFGVGPPEVTARTFGHLLPSGQLGASRVQLAERAEVGGKTPQPLFGERHVRPETRRDL
jgi:hypothetical protein